MKAIRPVGADALVRRTPGDTPGQGRGTHVSGTVGRNSRGWGLGFDKTGQDDSHPGRPWTGYRGAMHSSPSTTPGNGAPPPGPGPGQQPLRRSAQSAQGPWDSLVPPSRFRGWCQPSERETPSSLGLPPLPNLQAGLALWYSCPLEDNNEWAWINSINPLKMLKT